MNTIKNIFRKLSKLDNVLKNLSLVIIVMMKNITKVLATDLKELSELDKQALIIFHPKYEVYDNAITKINLLLFVTGFVMMGIGFSFTGLVTLGSALFTFGWWNSKV